MALDRLASKIKTSLKGRLLGLDNSGFVVGTPGTRHAYETVTTASTMANSGLTIIASTAATDHTISDPSQIGVEKTIVNNSTFAVTVTRGSGASFYWSTGTSPAGVKITLSLPGSAATLLSVSTSRWLLKGSPGSTAWMSVATSS